MTQKNIRAEIKMENEKIPIFFFALYNFHQQRIIINNFVLFFNNEKSLGKAFIYILKYCFFMKMLQSFRDL